MELSEIHSPLTTNGSTFASFARSSSESDFETLRSQLTSAKRAGQRNRRRISGTTGALAIILLVAVVALLFVAGATGRYVAPLLAPLAALLLLLVLLPTDRRAIYVVVCAFVFFMIPIRYYCVTRMVQNVYMIQRGKCRDHVSGDHLPDSWCEWNVFFWFGYAAALVYGAVAAAYTACASSPRATLQKLWSVTRLCLLTIGLLSAGDQVAMIAVGRRLRPLFFILKVVEAVEYLVLAAVASYPHTRARAQSALAARGEEASAAAGIAALVGGHLPEHVMAEGRRRLVCVTLDQVSFEDLADSEPNPARSKSARRKPGSVK
mmetsp:Transcript_17707/g.53905  ORF Transcript_17707/g.53905 Transcript_17707/m.53905 type:complete len:320 (+) Transcript_17707:1479-2438(+)